MRERLKKSKIVFMFGIFLIILGGISTMFYINLKEKTTNIAEATVTYVGNKYIVVEDEKKEEYALKTDQSYNVGDKVSFVIKDIKKDSYPKEGTVEQLNTISKSIHFVIEDPTDEETVSEDNSTEGSNDVDTDNSSVSSENDSSSTKASDTNSESYEFVTEEMKEEAVISYFENLNGKLDTFSQDKTLGESIKTSFVTVVDFLFYGGVIHGKTFNELTSATKLKVLQLIFTIDKKIDQHFPGYKEQISTTGSKVYTNIKKKAIESYLDLTTKVCVDNPDTCQFAKDGLKDLKVNFSLTWDWLKDISGVGLSKLKAWYEIWREA